MIGCINIWEEADKALSRDTVDLLSGGGRRGRLLRRLAMLRRSGRAKPNKSRFERRGGLVQNRLHRVQEHEAMEDMSTPPLSHAVPPPPRTTSPEGLTWSAHGATWFDLSVGFESIDVRAMKGDVGLSFAEFDEVF